MPGPCRPNVCLELLAARAGAEQRGRLRALAVARQPGDESVAARAEFVVRGRAQGAATGSPTGTAVPVHSVAGAGRATIFDLQAELGGSEDGRSSEPLGIAGSTNKNVDGVRSI